MKRTISLVLVLTLGLTMEVANADFSFGEPTNLGPTVNSSYNETGPCISSDGLSLYFQSERPGISGGRDIFVTTRPTVADDWGSPVNLGSPVSGPFTELNPYILMDSLELYFISNRPGGFGLQDIWISRREDKDDAWGEPLNLGSSFNSAINENGPTISAD